MALTKLLQFITINTIIEMLINLASSANALITHIKPTKKEVYQSPQKQANLTQDNWQRDFTFVGIFSIPRSLPA